MADTQDALDAYAAAKNRHDVDGIVALCTDDCSYQSMGLGGPIQGREALRVFYTALFSSLPDYRGDFDGRLLDGDTACVWGRFSGTTSESFIGVDVDSGRPVEVPVVFLCRFRDGLVASDRGYFDVSTLASQLGVSPSLLAGTPRTQASAFVQRFADYWAQPDPSRLPELVAPEALVEWPGTAGMRGAEYPSFMAAVLERMPDLQLEVLDTAAEGPRLFIHWRAQATVAGRSRAWTGTDRFVLDDGRAAAVHVAFDTSELRSSPLAGER